MTWEAHSFLCVSPDAVLTRHVQAIAGFSWGFTINQQDITFARPASLAPEAWDSPSTCSQRITPTGSSTADISPPNSLLPDRRASVLGLVMSQRNPLTAVTTVARTNVSEAITSAGVTSRNAQILR